MQVGTKELAGIIMADEVHLREVIDLQREFAERLKTVTGRPEGTTVPRLLHNILVCDDEIIEASLGVLGAKLKRFAKEIDFTHPDLVHLFGGAFSDASSFSQQCNELLLLGEYAKQNSLHILPSISKIIDKNDVHKRIWRQVDSPYNNRLHVRLIPDRNRREEIRSMKRTKALCLDAVQKKGQEFWTALPISFKRFLRFDETSKDEIERAKRKAERYRELGCEILCKEIEASIEDYRQQINDSYYGFNRITMTTAAVILAKSLGHKLARVGGFLYGADREYQIEVERNFFGKYVFDPEQARESEVKRYYEPRFDPFKYSPRVYPLHEFWSIAPSAVRDTINHLENFPDAGGKPIFDHFGLIVPGIDFPYENSEEYAFLNEAGEQQEYQKIDDARKSLDIILVESGYFHPVVLGEKDNKCYFISYFA